MKIGQIVDKTETCESTLNPKWKKGSMEFEVRSMREKNVSTSFIFYYSNSRFDICWRKFIVDTDKELI